MTLAPVSAASLTGWAEQLAPARQLAEIVAGTDFVPAALRNNPDATCACIMYGLSIGIEPMVALQSIHVVDGRPQPSAELARALVLAAGHRITIHEATAEKCRVSGLRAGAPESERTPPVEWTLDQARRAGLLNRPNWQRYPRAMLLARATGDLCRQAFPDAIKGLGYIAEDDPEALEAWANTAEQAEPMQQPTRAVRRKNQRQMAGRPVETVPLPESVPDGEPEPISPALDPWATPTVDSSAPHAAPHVPQEGPTAPDSAEPQPEAAGLSDSLRRSLMAACSRIGVDPTADRAMRLALWSALLGKRLETGRHLTRSDGLLLLRRMNDLETGAVEWDYSVETGAVTLRRIESEPPPDDH